LSAFGAMKKSATARLIDGVVPWQSRGLGQKGHKARFGLGNSMFWPPLARNTECEQAPKSLQ